MEVQVKICVQYLVKLVSLYGKTKQFNGKITKYGNDSETIQALRPYLKFYIHTDFY